MKIGDTAKFKNRYGSLRIVTKTSENEYTIEGKSYYCRGGTLNEGQKFFDLDGGPMLAVGDKISFLDVEDERRVVDFEGLDSGDDSYVKIKITVG